MPPPSPSPEPILRHEWLLLGLMCTVLLGLNGLWIQQNGWIRATDEAIHHRNALRLHRLLTGELGATEVLLPSPRERWRTGADESLYYPPLTYLVTGTAMFALGDGVKAADLSLGLFHVLLVVGLWWLARRVSGPRMAWLAVFLAGSSPYLLSYGRVYFLELPAVAWLVWAVLFLHLSRGFRRPWASLGFALCAVAGLYTRWNFALFLAAPTLWTLGQATWADRPEGRPVWPARLGLAASALPPIVAALVALDLTAPWSWSTRLLAGFTAAWWLAHGLGIAVLWWLGHRHPAHRRLVHGVQSIWLIGSLVTPWYLVYWPLLGSKYFVMFGDEAGGSLLWYLPAVLCFFWAAPLLLPAGLAWILRRRERIARHGLMLATLVGGLAATLTVTDANERYVLLLVPFAAWVAAAWVQDHPRLGSAVAALALLAAGWQAGGWLVLDPHHHPLQADIRNVGTPMPAFLRNLGLVPATAAAPEPEPPPVEAIATWLADRAPGSGKPHLVVIDQRHTHTPLETDHFRYHAEAAGHRLPIFQLNAPFIDPERADFLLWITHEDESFAFMNHVLSAWVGWDLRHVDSLSFPDGATGWFFRIRPRDRLCREEAERRFAAWVREGAEQPLAREGYTIGTVLDWTEQSLELDVFGTPVVFGPAEGIEGIDPDIEVGRQALVHYRWPPGEAPGLIQAWYLYTPTRFRMGMGYPPPRLKCRGEPPAPMTLAHESLGTAGELMALRPDAALVMVTPEDHRWTLDAHTRLPAAELFPGDRVCLAMDPTDVKGTRLELCE
jgi:4-amino-4-deoxy-L-arabinose transferase-like glycosyltransferase